MARFPTGPFDTHRTGCFGCVRQTAADGSCGIGTFPCQHFGVDMFATSPQVFAPEDGTVIDVADGNSAPFVGYGPGVVLMQGKSGFFHLLSHLDFNSIAVRPGQVIPEGMLVAKFDADTGHTHWEVRKQRLGSIPPNTIDPNQWLKDQLALVKPVTPTSSSTGVKVAAGLVAVGSVVGLSWLALRLARSAAVRSVG